MPGSHAKSHVPEKTGSARSPSPGVEKNSATRTEGPAESVLQLQRTLGNQGMQRMLRALVQHVNRGLQAGPEQALGQPAADTQRGNRNAVVQAQFGLQKEAVATPSESEVAEQAIQLEEAPDQRIPNRTGLPDQLKAGVESLSSISLDDVKVHYDSDKPAQLNAVAYTQGTDIHVAPGQEKHLPHEAWHIVQQKQGRVKPTMQMKGLPVNDDEGLEYEADVMGAKGMTSGAQFQRASSKQKQPAEPLVTAQATGSQDARQTAPLRPASAQVRPTKVLLRLSAASPGWDMVVQAVYKAKDKELKAAKRALKDLSLSDDDFEEVQEWVADQAMWKAFTKDEDSFKVYQSLSKAGLTADGLVTFMQGSGESKDYCEAAKEYMGFQKAKSAAAAASAAPAGAREVKAISRNTLTKIEQYWERQGRKVEYSTSGSAMTFLKGVSIPIPGSGPVAAHIALPADPATPGLFSEGHLKIESGRAEGLLNQYFFSVSATGKVDKIPNSPTFPTDNPGKWSALPVAVWTYVKGTVELLATGNLG